MTRLPGPDLGQARLVIYTIYGLSAIPLESLWGFLFYKKWGSRQAQKLPPQSFWPKFYLHFQPQRWLKALLLQPSPPEPFWRSDVHIATEIAESAHWYYTILAQTGSLWLTPSRTLNYIWTRRETEKTENMRSTAYLLVVINIRKFSDRVWFTIYRPLRLKETEIGSSWT